MVIRYSKKEDIKQIIALCKAHALYEKADLKKRIQEDSLSKHLFGPQKAIECIVVEYHHELVGYATFTKQFSTWDAEFYIYLDCLYLKETCRGKGIGRQIMNLIREYASTQQCNLIQWQTPDFNTNAIQFYTTIGAISKTKERFFWTI